MYAKIIGMTAPVNLPEWNQPELDENLALVEYAGRRCYNSYDNPSGRSTVAYVDNLIQQGHFSVLEHVNVSMEIECSRSVSHELVRHRHFSFSQESTRYVAYDDAENPVSVPPIVSAFGEDLPTFLTIFSFARGRAMEVYRDIYRDALRMVDKHFDGLTRKQRKQAALSIARAFLPQGLTTHLVMTGNLRAWLEFLQKRGDPAADGEMRVLVAKILDQLAAPFPSLAKYFARHEDVFHIPYLTVEGANFA